MKKNIRNIIITLIISISIIFGINKIAEAGYGHNGWFNYNVYSTSGYSWKNYLWAPNMWCIQRSQSLRSSGTNYTLYNAVHLEGLDAYDFWGNHSYNRLNAKLAYMVTQAHRNNNYGSRLNSNHGVVVDSPATYPPKVYIDDDWETAVWWEDEQRGIWNFINSWVNYSAMPANFGNIDRSSVEDGNPIGDETKLEKDGNIYAEGFNGTSDERVINNRPGEKNVSISADGQTIIVGPFNMSFPGTECGILISQDGVKFEGVSHNEPTVPIPSGKDFYLHIPISSGITNIKKVKIQSRKDSIKAANIYFYFTTANWQNIIITETYDDIARNYEGTFDFDIKITGTLTTIKVNAADENIKLPGVGFKFNNPLLGYIKQNPNGIITYVSESDATIFITDSNGKIVIKNVMVGTYNAKEVFNPHYGYVLNTSGTNINVVPGSNTQTIKNTQKYLKLTGYVWDDYYSGGKVETRNNLYGSEDNLLSGITVRIKDPSGNIVKNDKGVELKTTTASDGTYTFSDVEIAKLSNYYIEIEYDGLIYKNVNKNLTASNGSKGIENTNTRTTFNNEFGKIEGDDSSTGTRVNINGNRKNDLYYKKDTVKHNSTLDHLRSKYNITSNTNDAGYSLKDLFSPGEENLTNINFGVFKREEPDIALLKDVENVKVTINGYEHLYKYADRFKDVNSEKYKDGLDIELKFANKRGKETYTRVIYPSDIKQTTSSQREIKVIYRIRLINESTTLKTTINSIVDYYDANYTLSKVGTGISKEGEITGSLAYTDKGKKSNYKKAEINTNIEVEASNYKDIYIETKVTEEGFGKILEGSVTLDNFAEINSYTIKDKAGAMYAGIDKDSAPGNLTPGNDETYEDDTDKAPSFILSTKDNKQRKTNGIVFVDNIIESGTGKVRKGNETYENTEKGIDGVTVTMKEVETGKTYTDITKNGGKYEILDFVPGRYEVSYTWGDNTYTLQEYKATTMPSSEWDRKKKNNNWYKVETPRYSDAQDDYNTRLKVDDEITKLENGEGIENYTPTKMLSTSPEMEFNLEYDDTGKTGSQTNGNDILKTYVVKNIDFGIVERAKQKVNINKRISHIELLLPNGQQLTNVEIAEDGTVTGNNNHFTYFSETAKLELDNELAHGSTLKIKYDITAKNNSEVDYKDQNFYNYGIEAGDDKLIKIGITGIYDFLDNEMNLNSDNINGWEKVTIDNYSKIYNKEPTIEERKEATITTDSSGKTTIRTTIDGTFYGGITYDAWKEKLVESRKKNLLGNFILTEETLKKPIGPNKSNTVKLYASKELSDSEDIDLENEIEITRIKKDGGSKIITSESKFHDEAERVIVLPPTGENRNIIIYIAIGITSLIILGVGIIIIKKKALK